MKTELTWEHLSAYLPHKLKVQGKISGSIRQLTAVKEHQLQCDGMEEDQWDDISSFKPLLVPHWKIQSIVKEIYVRHKFKGVVVELIKGDLYVDYLVKGDEYSDLIYSRKAGFERCPAYMYNELLKKHVDLFDLINNGQAIPK